MRIIFIHGLGETESCFSEIAPELNGEHVFINLWEALGNSRRPKLNVINFCRELIDSYDINKEDTIIGHSTGGRLAHYIKHLNGNKVIQIASWTQEGKPRFPIKNRKVIYFLVRSGLLFTKYGSQYMIDNYKRQEQSKPYYVKTFENIIKGNRNCVVNQFKLALMSADEMVITEPDLRIHAKRDNVVAYPDEPYHEVPGDHFSLLTHPRDVLAAIKSVPGIL